MNEFLKVALPGLLGLLGVGLAAWFAVVQWRRQTRHQHADQFATDTKTAYKELWDRLEATHVALRVKQLDEQQVASSVRELNAFILRASLYLDPGDRTLANQYILEIQRLCDLVRILGTEYDKKNTELTTALDMSPVREIFDQERKAMAVREQIRTKIRNLLQTGNI